MKKIISSDKANEEVVKLREQGSLLINPQLLIKVLELNMSDRFFSKIIRDNPVETIRDILGDRWVSIPMYSLDEGTLTMYYSENSKVKKKTKYYKKGWEESIDDGK